MPNRYAKDAWLLWKWGWAKVFKIWVAQQQGFRLLKHAFRCLRILCVCAHGASSYLYHRDSIHEHCQEALSNSYGQDGAIWEQKRYIYAELDSSIFHSFLLVLYLRKHFYVCLYNPYFHCWLFHSAVKPTDFSRNTIILIVHHHKKRLQEQGAKMLGKDQGGGCSCTNIGQ